MVEFTTEIPLNHTTTSGVSESVTDRSSQKPIKWLTLKADNDCYIGINKGATTSTISLKAGESYTTPMKVRIITIAVLRSGSVNATIRGSAWA